MTTLIYLQIFVFELIFGDFVLVLDLIFCLQLMLDLLLDEELIKLLHCERRFARIRAC